MKKIILASCSLQRKSLLEQAGLKISVCPSHIKEGPIRPDQDPVAYALALALAKAENVAKKFKSGLVIGADTIVVSKNKVFGKPRDQAHAKKILSALSNKIQCVYTAVAVIDVSTGKIIADVEKTTIKARKLSKRLIAELSQANHDKAGAYAVQKNADVLVKEMKGDYYNVVGLPLKRVASILKLFSVQIKNLPLN